MKNILVTLLLIGMANSAQAQDNALPLMLQNLISQPWQSDVREARAEAPVSEQALGELESLWQQAAQELALRVQWQLAARIPNPIQ